MRTEEDVKKEIEAYVNKMYKGFMCAVALTKDMPKWRKSACELYYKNLLKAGCPPKMAEITVKMCADKLEAETK